MSERLTMPLLQPLMQTRSRVCQLASLATLYFAVACTGVVEGPSAGSSGAGMGSSGAGAGSPVGSGGSGTSAGGGASPGAAGGQPLTEPAPAIIETPRLARLSNVQWRNAVRDLLRLSDVSAITEQVTGDALVGFDNEAEALRVGEQLRVDLEKAAQSLADRVVGDAAALARIAPSSTGDVAARGRAFIESFGRRAYRRPLEPAEVDSYVSLFAKGPELNPGKEAFAAGVHLLLVAMLQSPHFLYRTELSTAASGTDVALSDYEVAAKLAFTLTNTIPDDALLDAAGAGKLRAEADVVAQANRLLDGATGVAGRDHFHFQVYRLGAYNGIQRDTSVFPDFTPETPAAMREEALQFLRFVFAEKRGVADLFTSNVSFVNAKLAPLYGLSGAYTEAFKRVELDASQRSGLLTQIGFLSSYAVVNDPDTIHRGVFVNQRILCRALPPPDANATTLVPLDNNMTNRERVDATTGPGTCGSGCHSTVINPPGFAFEHFDPVGKFRTTDRNKPINAKSSYDFSDGLAEFDGAVEFSRLLAKSPQAHSCYLQNWMSYVNARPLKAEDKPLLDYLAQRSLGGSLPIRDLVLELVTHNGFLHRLR